jgi:hypothetical protein
MRGVDYGRSKVLLRPSLTCTGLAARRRGLTAHDLPATERFSLARSVMPDIWPGWNLTPSSERVGDVIERSWTTTQRGQIATQRGGRHFALLWDHGHLHRTRRLDVSAGPGGEANHRRAGLASGTTSAQMSSHAMSTPAPSAPPPRGGLTTDSPTPTRRQRSCSIFSNERHWTEPTKCRCG